LTKTLVEFKCIFGTDCAEVIGLVPRLIENKVVPVTPSRIAEEITAQYKWVFEPICKVHCDKWFNMSLSLLRAFNPSEEIEEPPIVFLEGKK